ncbi:alkaline phosphatase [Alkalihalobacillus xiaoxiensis]|uniref:Alkaline phosphatase n=1 Tax=Shouchella xiaoxiensis TaxID=766895 RepID=A0ABS2SYE9_9BACI|nr:alkaline phosphatase [Shouchella xiaoxiensis]MBM7840557.1 alkaline phosphatase [Shouchella xiaoxiensis]
MKKRFKSYATLGLVATVILGGTAVSASDGGEPVEPSNQAKNVIFLIPDGFSQSYANSYKLYKDELPIWDELNLFRSHVMTHSSNEAITDSAAAGTAFATGKKTDNGVIGLSPDGEELPTIVDIAKQAGKRTGLVSTSTITHATPAAFAAKVESRGSYTEIAKQMIENDNLDLLFGGGRTEFLPPESGGIREDGLDLIDYAEENDYTYLETRRQLLNWDGESEKMLGLFAEEALEPAFTQRTDEPSLGEMTETAIEFLSADEDGFFLMVEGSQIDWAGHDNDPLYAMTDTEAFEEAVKAAIDYAEENQDTLVVMVGDHDTGGMAVHASEAAHPKHLKEVNALGLDMAQMVDHNYSNLRDVLEEQTNFEWTDEELDELKEAESLKLAINHAISEKTGFGWSSYNHTGIDVPLYAYGAGAEKFSGTIDNTDVPKKMLEALGLSGL